jgi:hypothetical protein
VKPAGSPVGRIYDVDLHIYNLVVFLSLAALVILGFCGRASKLVQGHKLGFLCEQSLRILQGMIQCHYLSGTKLCMRLCHCETDGMDANVELTNTDFKYG